MQKYRDLRGASNISRYDFGEGWIEVEFNDGSRYTYTDSSAGRSTVEEMQELAEAGIGLNSFINRHVRTRYASKS